MKAKIIEYIIDHIEATLNKPIEEYLSKYQANKVQSKFHRLKHLPEIKIYF